jgi:cytochrome P450 family 142 subfamily A polypeptide 1
MREHAPVFYDPKSDVWAITKYDDVLAIEKDAKGFSSYKAPRPHGEPLPMMISMDNPLHQRRRSLVYHGFTPKRVAEHEARIRAICNEIVDRVCERGECDFVWDVAAPLPLLLIADMLGFEPSAYDDLLRWSDDLIRATTAEPSVEVQTASLEASLGFRELQLEVIKDRRSKPQQSDLISLLCHSEVEGERLDDESIVQETLLILIGGDETTRHVITGGQLALFEHPDQWTIMRDNPSTMVSGTEEMLRWISPIKNMARTVVKDVALRGETLHAGDQVILMYPSANRDADEFPDPFTFDVRRDPNHHIAFGFGPHYCLGQALARLELNVMFDVLFRRLPDLEPANDAPLPYRASNFIVGPEAMPVRFTPTAKAGS